MGNEEDDDFSSNLSRKELQGLCKKYGLSANKANSVLVKSLISYLQKKNLRSMRSRVRSSGSEEASRPTSWMSKLQSRAQLDPGVKGMKGMPEKQLDVSVADSFQIIPCPREEDHNQEFSLTVKSNEFGGSMKGDTCIKVPDKDIEEGFGRLMCDLQETSCSKIDENSFNYRKDFPNRCSGNTYSGIARQRGVFNMPQIKCQDTAFGSSLPGNNYVSSLKSSNKVPSSSIEFYVRSEEGIKLFVDLNSSPSGWTRTLKDEVCICQNVQNHKSGSFQEELVRLGDEIDNKKMEGSFLLSTRSGHEINNSNMRSFPSSITREGTVRVDHLDVSHGSVGSSAGKACSVSPEVLGHLEKDPGPSLPSRHSSSGSESCPQDGGTATLDLYVSTPEKKSGGNSVVNSISDDPKSISTSEQQTSKLGNENCENSLLKNSGSSVHSGVLIPGHLESIPMEMQLSEVASANKFVSCSPCKNGGLVTVVDELHNLETQDDGLDNPRELNHKTFGSQPPTCTEESEMSNPVSGRESTGCSQHDLSSEKTCLKSDDSESNGRFQKKRQHDDGEDNNGSSKPNAKILRSTKYVAGEALPRRSMRLVSKV
ncbi:uncharacterized protein LOC131150351 isoform X3 [Malania oleifera]|uniref:uncharacterized protein LOC131150351 isoform X3 n=2 Tax=Malania oleifera TaxID=397392 RepID=UPI0025ADED21|nr:uncharacterized protein LOC131150351 isoform X3 [Malania oleifera]